MNSPAIRLVKAGTEKHGQGRRADSSRLVLSPRLRRLAMRVLPRQQYLAQHMEVAPRSARHVVGVVFPVRKRSIARISQHTAAVPQCAEKFGLIAGIFVG